MHDINLFQNGLLWSEIRDEVFRVVDKVHSSGMAQNSTLVKLLEDRIAELHNRKYCVTFASCTDALVSSCASLRLPPESRVAVSNYTFTATAHAVSRAGYTVVPIDVTDNYTIDVSKIGEVDAVIAVDIFGNMSDWDRLNALTVPVICDAAQSFESINGSGTSPSKGIVSCVSFSPSKTISSWGSGGALLTDDREIADYARRFRLHGKLSNENYSHYSGMNSMLSSFEAACIWVGLDNSEAWKKRRQEISRHIMVNSSYPCASNFHIDNTFHKLVFQSTNRAETMQNLKELGINGAIHYSILINDEPMYNIQGDFAKSGILKEISFTVPNQQTLTDEEVERVTKALK